LYASTKTLPVKSQHMVRKQVFNIASEAEAASFSRFPIILIQPTFYNRSSSSHSEISTIFLPSPSPGAHTNPRLFLKLTILLNCNHLICIIICNFMTDDFTFIKQLYFPILMFKLQINSATFCCNKNSLTIIMPLVPLYFQQDFGRYIL
jgi:hypothetical protein